MKPNRTDALEVLKPVNSSFIQRMGFKPDKVDGCETITGNVYVEIKNVVTAYEEVPESVYNNHKNFPSLGVWYNANLKGKYISSPVNMDPLKEFLEG